MCQKQQMFPKFGFKNESSCKTKTSDASRGALNIKDLSTESELSKCSELEGQPKSIKLTAVIFTHKSLGTKGTK